MSSFSISPAPYAKRARRAKALARELAVGCVARADLPAVRRVDRLIVGIIELCLVHVEPHAGSLGALRLGRAVLGMSRASHRSRGGYGSEKRASGRGHEIPPSPSLLERRKRAAPLYFAGADALELAYPSKRSGALSYSFSQRPSAHADAA